MLVRLLSHLSYANVVSTICLFVVFGGTAYAATTLPNKSVGSAQLKANAVTSEKVQDGALLRKDFKAGQLLAGPRGSVGATGAPGAQGPGGPQGAQGARASRASPAQPALGPRRGAGAAGWLQPEQDRLRDGPYLAGGFVPGLAVGLEVLCPAGDKVIGGGFRMQSADTAVGVVRSESNSTGTGWVVELTNTSSRSVDSYATAICAAP